MGEAVKHIRRRLIFIFLAAIGAVLLGGVSFSFAQDTGSIDGVWEGRLDWVHAPGLLARDYPFQVWRIQLQGTSAKMFIVRDGKLQEVYPGKWKVERLDSNVLIHGITSGTDSDGQWVATSSFTLLKRDSDTLGVVTSAAVNNTRFPLTSDISKFFQVKTGNFHRVR